MKSIFAISLLVSGTAYAASQQWVKPIDISGHVPGSVKQIGSTIDAIAKNVASCIGAGKSRNECICSQKSGHARLRTLYNKTLSEHPKWRNSAVSYREGDVQHFVSFEAIELQLRQYDELCK